MKKRLLLNGFVLITKPQSNLCNTVFDNCFYVMFLLWLTPLIGSEKNHYHLHVHIAALLYTIFNVCLSIYSFQLTYRAATEVGFFASTAAAAQPTSLLLFYKRRMIRDNDTATAVTPQTTGARS